MQFQSHAIFHLRCVFVPLFFFVLFFDFLSHAMTVKVAIAQINSTVGDLAGNRARIVEFSRRAAAQGADIVLTPELSLVGYPPEDFYCASHSTQKHRRRWTRWPPIWPS
jgi:hypothetical protein